MKLKFYASVFFISLLFSNCTTRQTLSFAGWEHDWMEQVKSDLRKEDTQWAPAYSKLIADADKALSEGVYSVTFKKMVPPSGSKNDYMSMGPYWWPDPEKPDGLPYIRRDGEVNPERDELDSPQLSRMINAVKTLSLAWYFSDNKAYADKAAELIRVWFLNPKTLMNPHLNYGQSIPGRTDGRFIGIIDGRSFAVLVDAITLLETSGSLSDDEEEKLRAWFEMYYVWLTESEFGKEEEDYINNHSVAFDVQAGSIAYFLGKEDYVKKKAAEVPERRIGHMIESDGSQPHELIRTRAYSYSVSNLSNFFDIGIVGRKVGVDIFSVENSKGGSLKKALDYLIGYLGRESDWPYEQISSWEQTENNLGLLIRRASVIYDSEEYLNIWNQHFQQRLNNHWKLLVEPELKTK